LKHILKQLKQLYQKLIISGSIVKETLATEDKLINYNKLKVSWNKQLTEYKQLSNKKNTIVKIDMIPSAYSEWLTSRMLVMFR
jgi:hypothetical protein